MRWYRELEWPERIGHMLADVATVLLALFFIYGFAIHR